MPLVKINLIKGKKGMKKLIFIFTAFGLFISLFAAERKVTESVNEFGGETVEFNLSPDEADYEQFTKVVFSYDISQNKRKVAYYLSKKTAKESGYVIQEEYYENENPIEYRMFFSEEEIKKHGITTVIEKINYPNYVIYTDGEHTVYSNMESFVHNYSVLALSYLEQEFFSDPKSDKSKGNRYIVDARYKKARSFVTFTSDFKELNKLDEEILKFYSDYMEAPEMKDLYFKKAYAKSKGKKYTVYIQKNLEPYIKKNLTCLLAYGVIGYNNELFLISTEFEELSD